MTKVKYKYFVSYFFERDDNTSGFGSCEIIGDKMSFDNLRINTVVISEKIRATNVVILNYKLLSRKWW